MAETMISSPESNAQSAVLADPPAPPSDGSLFHRRIEFHLAKKPFTGFSNGGGGFRLETLNPSSSDPRTSEGSALGSGSSAAAGKKQDGAEILDVGLDPELSLRITFKRIGAGLENLGNTCFLNSVLQCLTYTEPLAAYLQSGKHQNSCRTAGFCALCAIQKHVSRALQLSGRSLAPNDLVSNLRCISRNFRNARQEDAHEYMVNLLESMHKCCLPAGVPSESPSAYEKSLVHNIFGGRLRSQVKCMQCSFCSNKFDPFLDLSLEILKAESLHKALTHFTAKEYLDGGERQYQCQKCNQKVRALKQLTIHKAPHVLTIHLKRFGSHQPGQKIDKKVLFGPALDLKPFVTGPYDGDLKYTLYGVLVHAGWSTHSGHYYCFVRTSSGMWYSLDDHQVRQVSEKVVLEQKAYMLFYVRDRRHFTPKKPVDVKKESMIMNAMGATMQLNSNQGLKGTVQNGSVDKKVNLVDSLATLTPKRETIAGALNENLLKEASLQKTDTLIVLESLAPKEDTSHDVSSTLSVSKDAVNGLSVRYVNGEEGLTITTPLKGSGDSLDGTIVAPTLGKSNECNSKTSVKKLSDLVGPAADCCSPQSFVAKEDPSNVFTKLPDKNEGRDTMKDLNDSVSVVPDCNGHHSSPGDDVCMAEKAPQKINILPKESTLGDSSQLTGATEAVGLFGPPSKGICHQGVCERKHQQNRKKLPKCQITTFYFNSSILFRASLSLRKKKHKRIRRRAVKINNLSQEHLLDKECGTADFGPSTSEITKTLSRDDAAHSRSTLMKSGLRKKDGIAVANSDKSSSCNGVEGINDEFGARLDESGAMLVRNKKPQKSSDSAGIKSDARGSNCLKESRIDAAQNGLMSVLTRGLDETIVSCWDDIELSTSQITESSAAETVNIGYIADEWDEEYDRGKRKKVRNSKNMFGGPNPFQEFAAKKAKLKKMKMDKSSSGNEPFRL